MDDFNISNLHESKNEWVSRLVNVVTPHIVEGLKSMFTDSFKLCIENNEEEKYLMTFQNFLTRVPKWNDNIIENEVKRIIESSNCSYIEDLITCVHIVQLKTLTCIRVGQKQKKIDIDIPKINDFIHKVYINVARKVYTNVYLFEKDVQPLELQRNNRELEIIVKECILNSVRESIPIDSILKSYLEQTEEIVEEDFIESTNRSSVPIDEIVTENSNIKLKTDDKINVNEDIKLQVEEFLDKQSIKEKQNVTETTRGPPFSQPTPSPPPVVEASPPVVEASPPVAEAPPVAAAPLEENGPVLKIDTDNVVNNKVESNKVSDNAAPETLNNALKFSNYDKTITVDNKESVNVVPKTTYNLERISDMRHEERKLDEENNYDEDDDTIKIMDDTNIDLGAEVLDITTL